MVVTPILNYAQIWKKLYPFTTVFSFLYYQINLLVCLIVFILCTFVCLLFLLVLCFILFLASLPYALTRVTCNELWVAFGYELCFSNSFALASLCFNRRSGYFCEKNII